MEIKEAIEQLKWYFENDDGSAAENKTKKAAYMAISALEKQEGKKPLQACGHATELFKRDIPLMNYCPICGQKIDWSE